MEVTPTGNKFRDLRISLGFNSQEAFARYLGVTLGAVGGWERGKRPSYANIRKLSQVSGKPISYFYDEDVFAA